MRKLKANNISSIGTASIIPDYKTGKPIHVLSQGEKWFYYLLRWDDETNEIYTQVSLDYNLINKIGSYYNIKTFCKKSIYMSSDILLIKNNGDRVIYSIKNNRKVLNQERILEKLFLEKIYWTIKKHEYHIVFKEDLNRILINNIIDVCYCYDSKRIIDIVSFIRYLIAHKVLIVDMESSLLNYETIYKNYKEIIDEYYKSWRQNNNK